MANVTNSAGGLYLEGDWGCSTVDNHDEDVIWGNITLRNGGINDEYYDAFAPFASKVGWNELCAVSIFILGLQPEIRKKVSIFNLKMPYDTYCLAIMQEATKKLLKESCNKIVDSDYLILDVSDCLKSVGSKMITNKEKNDGEQDIGKKEDSNCGIISVNNSKISVVDDSGKREQKKEMGNDIGDEGIESNNANGVVDITIGLMGCDDGMNVSFSMNGNSDCVVMDGELVEECLSGMQMEADKPSVEKFEKKSVEKNGNEGEDIEFIVGDIIREEGFEEDRKNVNNSFSNLVGKKKYEIFLVKSDWKKSRSAVCTFPRNTYEMDQFDEAVHEFSLVNVCWLLRSTQVSLRKYAKRSRVSIVYWKFDIGVVLVLGAFLGGIIFKIRRVIRLV
ncbi:hypothetical protein Tco_0418227 [Tanacetum coccineum]